MMTTIFIAYIIGTPALTVLFCAVVPEWRFDSNDAVTGLLTIFLLLCWLFGGALGFFLPQWLAERYGDGSLGALGRVAQVVGALCGFAIAYRGTQLFATLGLLGFLGVSLFNLGTWVLQG